jgi:signal transduction histidine kinase/CheY-like chemotaxis protein
MIRRFNAHLDRAYSGLGGFHQQKAKALAWVSLATFLAIGAILVKDLAWGTSSAMESLQATGGILVMVGMAFVLVTSGLLGKHFDWLLLALAVVHVAASAEAGAEHIPQNFYCGSALYAPCALLAAAAFGRRSIFFSVAILEIGWTALYGPLFLRSARTGFEDYFRLSQSENVASLLVVGAMALGFVAMVDRALRMFQEELDINRELQADLERKVADRTADLEMARRSAQSANLAKSTFLADVSHEIRTPLNGIMGMSDLLRDTGLTPDQQEKVGMLRESGAHLLGLIEGILDHARIEEGRVDLRPEPTALRPFLGSTLDPLRETARAKGVVLAHGMREDVPEGIHVDRQRLRQILTNLVGNALKFTERGEVGVFVAVVPATNSSRLEISVRDTGIGMDQDALSRIFRRFAQEEESTRRRFGGTGLGLVISRGLARAMGGDLRAESTPGNGSTFILDLPMLVASIDSPPASDAAEGSGAALEGVRILLVEDDRTNRKVADGLLARMGCEVVHSGDGIPALELLSKASFDLVLMDCNLPNMDGYEATRTIRSWANDPSPAKNEASRTPIVALTASTIGDVHSRCMTSGMDEVLTKPLIAARLRETLERWLPKRA